ncbi:MAG: bNR repeat protein [uncultured bacterium]|nr:MAG: bNR repeat protein [uncultured bacterium]
MKKRLVLILPFLSIFIFSGCSLSAPVKEKTSLGGFEVFDVRQERGSLWKTADGGHTFESKSQINEQNMISSADILSIDYHPQKPKVIYVSSVESGIFKTENAGETWQPIAFPPKKIYSFLLDRSDPDNRMFAAGVVSDWGKIFRTKDGGANWEEVYTEPGQKVTITSLAQHPRETNVIFAGTSKGTVVKSVDAGDTWKNIGSEVDGLVSHIAFDSRKNPSTYLLMFDKKFYYSSNGGSEWIDWEKEKDKEVSDMQKKAADAAQKGNTSQAKSLREKASDLSKRNKENKMPSGIVSITADPTLSGVVYAGTKNGFFRGVEHGKYWYEINIIESGKGFPIRSIAVNHTNPKEIVYLAGKAFYKSKDNGATWEVTGLEIDRDAAFVSYDPFDTNFLFLGLREF